MSHVERVSPRVVSLVLTSSTMDQVIAANLNRGYTVLSVVPYRYCHVVSPVPGVQDEKVLESVLVTLVKDASTHGAQLLRAQYLDEAEKSKVETANPTPANPAVLGSGERAEPFDLETSKAVETEGWRNGPDGSVHDLP